MNIFLFLFAFCLFASLAECADISGQLFVPSTIAPVGDMTMGQGTDPLGGRPAIDLLPPLPVDHNTITKDFAAEIEEYATASISVYEDKRYPLLDGWTLAAPGLTEKVESNKILKKLSIGVNSVYEVIAGVGFHAAAYRSPTGQLIVAFEGTDISESGDILTDLSQIVIVPGQYQLGVEFVKKVKAQFPGERMTMTGHSLGGGIAQYVAAILSENAVTFNPAGLFKPVWKKVDNTVTEISTGAQIRHFVAQGFFYKDEPDSITFLRGVAVVREGKDLVSTSPLLGKHFGSVYKVPYYLNNDKSSLFSLHSMVRLQSRIVEVAVDGINKGNFFNGVVLSDEVQAPSTTRDLTIVAVVDSSGSMSQTDPEELRVSALEMMLDSLSENTVLGIVDFDDSQKVLVSPQPLGDLNGDIRKKIREAIRSINTNGGTNIGGGLKAGLDLLDPSMKEVCFVLLTDGQDKNWHGEFETEGLDITVHTIALSDQADQNGLSKVSADTGGESEIASTAGDLQRIMGILFGMAEGDEVILIQEGNILLGDLQEYLVWVEAGQSVVEFRVSWPGSDIDLILLGPDGREYTVDQAVTGGYGVEAETYDLIRVKNPLPGQWKVQLQGVDIDPKGEPFTLRVAGKDGKVQTEWKVNPPVPEVGEPFTVNLAGDSSVAWQSAKITEWDKSGQAQQRIEKLNSLSAMLGGQGGQTVYSIVPAKSGVNRVQVIVSGIMPDGQPIMRTMDRTFRVAPQGQGVHRKVELDPFIRR